MGFRTYQPITATRRGGNIAVSEDSDAARAFKIEGDVETSRFVILPPDMGTRKRECYRDNFDVRLVEFWFEYSDVMDLRIALLQLVYYRYPVEEDVLERSGEVVVRNES